MVDRLIGAAGGVPADGAFLGPARKEAGFAGGVLTSTESVPPRRRRWGGRRRRVRGLSQPAAQKTTPCALARVAFAAPLVVLVLAEASFLRPLSSPCACGARKDQSSEQHFVFSSQRQWTRQDQSSQDVSSCLGCICLLGCSSQAGRAWFPYLTPWSFVRPLCQEGQCLVATSRRLVCSAWLRR